MMQAKDIGRFVGTASLSFGVTDILLGNMFGRGIGAGEAKGGLLFRTVGLREVATGAAGLAWPTSSVPIWTRFGADLADMAALGRIISRPNPKRGMAALALAIVAGVTAMDLVCARAIDRKNSQGG